MTAAAPPVGLVEPEVFRAVMAAVCTPVAVVTAMDGNRPHGTTVSAFASLSLRPPMVVIALDHGSDLLAYIRHEGRFGLNVLASHQHDIAQRFARKGHDKFAEVAWVSDSGVPRIAECAGWLACAVADSIVGGDHTLVLGTVDAASQRVAAQL